MIRKDLSVEEELQFMVEVDFVLKGRNDANPIRSQLTGDYYG